LARKTGLELLRPFKDIEMASPISTLLDLDRRCGTSLMGYLTTLVCCAAIAIGWWAFQPEIVFRMPDSTSYLRFDDYRGAGYPMLLDITKLITGTHNSIPLVQHLLLFSGITYLGLAVQKTYKSIFCGLAIAFLIGGNIELVRYNFTLLTESLFFTSTMLLLGCILGCKTPSPTRFIICGAIVAWLILIKPVGWAFVALPILLIVNQTLNGRKFLPLAISTLIGFLLVTGVGSAYRYHHFGVLSPASFVGNQIIGKLIYANFNYNELDQPVAGKFWLDNTAQFRELNQSLFSELDEKLLFSLNIYDYMRFTQEKALFTVLDTPNMSDRQAQHEFAMSIIKLDPMAYVRDIALQVYSLWTIAILQTQDSAKRYMKKVESAQQTVPAEVTIYTTDGSSSIVITVLKLVMIGLAIISGVSIIFSLYRILYTRRSLDPVFQNLFIIASTIWSYFFLVALFQAALLRYILAAWPMLTVFGLLFLLFGLRLFSQKPV